MGGSKLEHRARWIAVLVATAAVGCSPREPDRIVEASVDASEELRSDAGIFDEEQRVVAGTVAAMLSETPRRAIGVMLLDARGPRFHTFGPRSLEGSPFDPDTTFEIGSVSKVFAGVLLAEAERRGEVELDAPIAHYLPDWSLPSRDGRLMTLRHAATHTTGLPLMPTNWVKTAGGKTRYTEQMFRDNLASYVLDTSPGERYVYGNLNTALIGLTLSRRTGRAYSALLQERIFDPLGMHRSGYPDVQHRIDDNALDGYEDDESLSIPRVDVSPLGPCCVVRSTLRDMSRFVAAALGAEGPLVAAFRRAATPQRPIDPNDVDSRWMGLGWEVDRRLGLLRKSGQVAGYRCELVLQPHEGRGLFVLVNSMRAKILGLSDGLIRALWDPRPLRAREALATARIDRLPDSAQRTAATFGDAIALEGWEAPARAEPGTTIEVTLYWRSTRPIADDYRVLVHGDPPASGAERATADHYVRAAGATTTTRDWAEGLLVRDSFRVPIPEAFPPGEMRLWLGWSRGSVRLPAASAARAIDDNRVQGPSILVEATARSRPIPLAAAAN